VLVCKTRGPTLKINLVCFFFTHKFLRGPPIQDPSVKRMSSEDVFQLAKMYEDFCPSLAQRTCGSGERYLANFACDGIDDCKDGSDESAATCSELCDREHFWVSQNGCNDVEPYLGKYSKVEGKPQFHHESGNYEMKKVPTTLLIGSTPRIQHQDVTVYQTITVIGFASNHLTTITYANV
jgi:hypothetical protein